MCPTTDSGRSPGAGSARWRRIGELLSAALEVDRVQRPGFLEKACGDDREMLAELRSLLDAHERPGHLDRLGEALEEAARASDRATPPAPAAWGDRVGSYRILAPLGAGGVGMVYRAHDDRLDREVALKLLSPVLLLDSEWRARFLAEARAAATLDHPNICTIHEIGEAADGRLFMVMPRYEGRTLDAVLEAGRPPASRALDLAGQACAGLARAHAHGIVHRDVTTTNLMITTDGILKILDFGLAGAPGAGAGWPRAAGGRAGGVPVGTVPYMSPEQVRDEPVDHRTDVWSLGVVLYELLTGSRPFEGARPDEVWTAIVSAEPEPPSAREPELPAAIDDLLARLLAEDPVERDDDLGDTARELAEIRERIAPSRRGAGPPLPSRPPAVPRAGERRQATVLAAAFSLRRTGPSDVAGEPDPLVARLRRIVEPVVLRHGGRVEPGGSGELMGVFGVPTAREDDSLRAVRAARELQSEVKRRTAEDTTDSAGGGVRLQAGVETGMAVAHPRSRGEAEARVTGEPVRAARRLAAAAPDDGILIGPGARRVVAPFFRTEPAPSMRLRRDGEPLTAWQVLAETGVRTRMEAAIGSTLTPFAGRREELELLAARLGLARSGAGQFVSVSGAAGAGKSRLLHELGRRLDAESLCVVRGSCRTYGGAGAYLPFRESVRGLLGLEDDAGPAGDRERAVARLREVSPDLEPMIPLYLHLLSIPSGGYALPSHLRGEHFRAAMLDALGALFTLAARERPLVLMLEDWHDADDASSQVLERLLELVPAHAMLVVVTHRPGYGVAWPEAPVHTPIRLGPLDRAAATEVVRGVLGAEQVPRELASALHERAGGNPFFLEELSRALHERGAVRVEEGGARVRTPLDGGTLPETVQGVIRARLDRIDPEAAEALRVAAVIGREFDRDVVADVLPDERRFERCLERLTALRLVQPIRVLPRRMYRFQHALTREVAYDSLPPPERRRLHGRVGRAFEASASGRMDELLADLAHHFAEAGEWEKAGDYGHRAARRAVALSEFEHALELMDRARRCLAEASADERGNERIVRVLLEQERICETLGLRERQQRIIDELFERLDGAGDAGRLADVYLRQGDLHILDRRFDEAARALTRALRLSRRRNDTDRERNTRRSIGLLHWRRGAHDRSIRQLSRALEIDRERGDAEAVAGDLANLGSVLRSGGRPDRALRCLEEALTYARRAGNPVREAYTLHAIGNVHRALGDDDRALRYYERGRTCTTEHHLAIPYSFHLTAIAHIRLRRGEVEASLELYREAVRVARRAKHADGLSQATRILGEVLQGLGRHEEALSHLERAETLFARLGDRDEEARARARAARSRDAAELDAKERSARALRGSGDVPGALDAAREAAALAAVLRRPAREASLSNTIGILEWERGEHVEALRAYERALDALERAGDARGRGLVLNSIGVTLSSLGRHEDAIARLEAALEHNRAHAARQWEAHGLAALADSHAALGDRDAARACLELSLQIRREIGDRVGEGWMLHDLARLDPGGASAGAALAVAESAGDERLMEACRRLHAAPRDT